MDMRGDVSSQERQRQILYLIGRSQRVTVNQVVAKFAISQATARRDLEALAEQGKVRRVHGGAIAVRGAPAEPPVLLRKNEQSAEKRRIGQAAAELVSDGETVFLGSGTSVVEVATHLRTRRALTVITNSLLVLNALADVPTITVIGLGGGLNRSGMSFIGHIAAQALSELRTNKVIFSIRGIDVEHGLTNDDLQETMVDRVILTIAREVIIVADHTKCGRVAAAVVAPLTSVNTLVTDGLTSPEFVAGARAQGVRVISA
ncbi:MAG: DeoR/GlpR transcriptional regulator [Anaerolineales bacterium]|nr:DeoR/GlpR transcriptional regulator [Anaerolineales bacterium]